MKEMDDFIYYDDYANSNGVRVRGNKEFWRCSSILRTVNFARKLLSKRIHDLTY
jgi:hypothetical protein